MHQSNNRLKHYGLGATLGSVFATTEVLLPTAVGVDIGCGMLAGVV